MPEGGHLPPLNWPDLTRARDERPTKVTGSRLVVWPLGGGGPCFSGNVAPWPVTPSKASLV